jgi:hypothetical protein
MQHGQPPHGQPPQGQYPGQYPPGQYPQQQGHYPPPHGQPGYGQPPQQPQPQPQPPQAPANLSPATVRRVQEALTQIDLLAGEQVQFTLQADGFFLGAHPLLKMIAWFQSFMVSLTGGHIRIFLIVTNQRVLVIRQNAVWCGMSRGRGVLAVALSGIKEVGSARETHLCCVHTRTVQVQSLTQLFNLVVKRQTDAEIRSFVSNLSAVLVAHSNRASV